MHELGQARKLGLKLYRGAPCPHCHGRVRYVSNRSCAFCNNAGYDRAAGAALKRAYRARQRLLASPAAELYRLAIGAPASAPRARRRTNPHLERQPEL